MLKLNLGCGDRYVDGWVNVDLPSCPHKKDVAVDLTNDELPWEPGEITHVFAGHLLEHLTRDDALSLARKVLELVNPRGGLFVVVGPDMVYAREHPESIGPHHSLESIVHGAGRWAGDEHLWETTGAETVKLLGQAGWNVVRQIDMDTLSELWPVAEREHRWQFVVRAWAGDLTRVDI